MFSYREFTAVDLLDLNLVNLDEKTVSFTLEFYLRYLSNSKYCISVLSSEDVVGYVIGHSGLYKNTDVIYSHITAISISQWNRGFGLGKNLLEFYNLNSEVDKSEFIDLFVRESNRSAIEFYSRLGYIRHELIEGYYDRPTENAYDMRLYRKIEGIKTETTESVK